MAIRSLGWNGWPEPAGWFNTHLHCKSYAVVSALDPGCALTAVVQSSSETDST
jgi:hypothetical protein